MGTPSMIGFWNNEVNTVTASYCHYDGYLEGNGRTLVEFYNKPEQAKMVAYGGYLSGLSEDYIRDKQTSVHKDPSINYSSVDDYLKTGGDYADAHYLYLFDGENWFFSQRTDSGFTPFEEVKMNLKVE
jgi:hypothetical protein